MTRELQKRIERSMDELGVPISQDDDEEPPPKRARHENGEDRPRGGTRSLRRGDAEDAPRAQSSRAAQRRQREREEEEEEVEEEDEEEAPRAGRRNTGKDKAPARGFSRGRARGGRHRS
jgi:hypothetical protein